MQWKKTLQNHPSAFGHILSLSLLGLLLSEFSLDMVFIIYQNPHFGNAIELGSKGLVKLYHKLYVSISMYIFSMAVTQAACSMPCGNPHRVPSLY